jgi:trafficking protein particle complex subunit 9
MFSPLAFPTGMIVYDLTTFYPPPSHLTLSPFEMYREPLVILALADGAELDHVSYRGNPRRNLNVNGPPRPEHNMRELYQDLEDLRDRYPKALVHQLLLFDYTPKENAAALPEGLVAVPPVEQCRVTTMKTIMCDISSMLLAEMTTLAKSLQALNTIESPSNSQVSRQFNGSSWPTIHGEQLSRRNSQYSLPEDSRSSSPAGSVDRSHVRMSMPVFPPGAGSTSSTPSARPTTPMNGVPSDGSSTFDDIVGPNGSPRNLQRNIPPRLGDLRSSSSDRVSVQGFGSNSISERSRNKGKSRVGIVIGSLYMIAGRWGDALKELIEAAYIARSNLDHLWHAKALDNIVVCMIMLAWTGLDFQIPQICYVSTDQKAVLAPTPQPPDQQKSPASNRLVSLQNLVALLPELLDRILNLYTRAANNTGESLPQYYQQYI